MSETKYSDDEYNSAISKFKELQSTGAIEKYIKSIKEMKEKNKLLESTNANLNQQLSAKQAELDKANAENTNIKQEYNTMFAFYEGIMTNLKKSEILGGK